VQDIVFAEQAENLDRKNFTVEEQVRIGREIERVLGEASWPAEQRGTERIPQDFALRRRVGDAAFVACAVGLGNAESYGRRKMVVDAAVRHPKKHGRRSRA